MYVLPLLHAALALGVRVHVPFHELQEPAVHGTTLVPGRRLLDAWDP